MQQFSSLRLTIFVICVAVGAGGWAITNNWAPLAIGAVIGLYLLYAIRVVRQWEKVAVLRFGRYIGLREPGMFFMIPVVDTLSQVVDQRVRVTSVSAESTLTRDTVPVNVDAITLSAQTALRESMGRELQRLLDEKTNPWGITVQSVEIRDVTIPQALQDAMSRQAQAERERQARIILGDAEAQIAEKFAKAAETYSENPVALHLRAMNMLYEAIKEKGAMVIVPSTAVETMGLGGTLATASMTKKQ
jgi:regulator of protease activity HflC (stomatin/prohibitin superfamily)